MLAIAGVGQSVAGSRFTMAVATSTGSGLAIVLQKKLPAV
jgi:hypothetical protein